MTPAELRAARLKLRLNQAEMARMLGYETDPDGAQVNHMEAGRRTIRPAQRRLVELYLAGARPPDWPRKK
jgi:transcriptional regulator with XRE-family HTH domain